MSLHDFSHGPYDDDYFDINYYFNSDYDSDCNTPEESLIEYCKNYNDAYNGILASFKSIEKLYRAIEKLENMLNIDEERKFYKIDYSNSFNFKPIEYEEVLERNKSVENGIAYMDKICEEINEYEDWITKKRLDVCSHLRKLSSEANIELDNWGKINKFLS